MSSFISSSIKSDTNFFGATQAVIPAPAGLVGGETLIAFVGNGSQLDVATATGWTPVGQYTASGAGNEMSTWTRLHDATATSYTFGWAGAETAIMGGIAAFSTSLLSVVHSDGTTKFNETNPAGNSTATITEHTATVNAEVCYVYYAVSSGQFTTSTLTMPVESTVLQTAYWIPADVGTARAIISISSEVVDAASEPSRSANLVWGQVGASANEIFIRLVAVDVPAATGEGDHWGWVS